jgi:cytochrome P450
MTNIQSKLMGDLPAFAADPIGFVEARTIGVRRPVPVRFGPRRSMLVGHTAAIKQILVDDRDLFEKGAEQGRMRPLMGDGMITANGPKWHAAREATKFGFSAAGLQDGLQLAMRCLNQELSDLASHIGEVIPVHEIMGRLSMRMVTSSLFHANLDAPTVSTLCAAGATAHRRLSEMMCRLIDVDGFLPTRKSLEYKRAIKVLEAVATDLSQTPGGILCSLAPVVAKHGPCVLRDQIITMLVAGFDTTATAACWVAYTLATRPDLVAWLRPEADAVVKRDWGLDVASLREMPRARAFVQEVLRVYPSGWWLARVAHSDMVLDGVSIKKGTSLLVFPWILHRQPDLWPEPLVIDPMRFFEKRPPEKFAYLPFGAGPRSCIGQHLAMAELTAITATLVSAFDLEPLSGPMHRLKPIGGVTLGPPPGMIIRLHMRPQLRKVA